MDDPNKPKDQPANQPNVPQVPKDPAGPPPDPRGRSDLSAPINQDFDPDKLTIESPVEDQAEDIDDKGALPQADVTKPTPEMQINPKQGKFRRFITSKKLWLGLLVVVLVAAIALWFIQETRVWIVNAIGLRVPVTVTARTVAETGQPSALLQKASVSLNGIKQESDEKGQVKFNAEYGKITITAEKTGFEAATQTDFYDFNPFFGLIGAAAKEDEKTGELQLKSVGLPLKFKVLDWLTEQPVTSGEFTVNEVVANPDAQGMVSLKIPPTDLKTVKVTSKAGGYVDKEFELTLQPGTEQQVALVPTGKSYFISKRTGQLGVYSSDLDGSNVQQVVAPSANESASIDFSASPDGKYGVLASSREGKRDAANNLLQKLYVVDLQKGSLSAVDEGLWFDFKDWSEDSLVYTTNAESNNQRLASVDTSASKKTDLSNAINYLQVRVSLGNAVYLMNNGGDPLAGIPNNPELRVAPVTGGTEKLLGGGIKAVTQTDYDKVAYQGNDSAWHEYNVNTATTSNASAPSSANRVFLGANSQDGQTRLFIDKVDGVSTLFTKSVATGEEKKLYTSASLNHPVRWVGNLVTFRLADQAQTADYIMTTSMTIPKKIGDVTASSSPQNDNNFSFN